MVFCDSPQHGGENKVIPPGGGRSGVAVSTIEEVRAAEKRVQRVVDALRKASAQDPNHLADELKKATDEYARLVRELNSK